MTKGHKGLGMAIIGCLLGGAPLALANSASGGVIAYVKPLPNDDQEIRVLKPDGTGDHVLLRLPKQSDWPTLAWRPDGKELAFTSSHDQTRSLLASDVYAVQPDGKKLRPITNAPDPATFGKYKKASVTVNVEVLTSVDGTRPTAPWWVYVVGAPEAKMVTGSGKVRFDNVAVFPGHDQPVVAMHGLYRWLNFGVPLIPGAGNDRGVLSISGSGLRAFGASAFSWKADSSALMYLLADSTFQKVAAYPEPGSPKLSVTLPSLNVDLPEYAPTVARKNEFLYLSSGQTGEVRIMLGREGQASGSALLSLTRVFGLTWLPDGSGFVFSTDNTNQSGQSVGSDLWEYDFATKQPRQITHLGHDWAYRMSVAPDGRQIVFERGTETAIEGLWIVDRDGSHAHFLVKDAVHPTWGIAQP